jgi:hypothetical protein
VVDPWEAEAGSLEEGRELDQEEDSPKARRSAALGPAEAQDRAALVGWADGLRLCPARAVQAEPVQDWEIGLQSASRAWGADLALGVCLESAIGRELAVNPALVAEEGLAVDLESEPAQGSADRAPVGQGWVSALLA